MTKLVAGERYTTKKFFSGESRNGPWELLCIADERGKNEITIFPDNIPSGAAENCDFVVKEIKEIKYGPKLNKKTEKWEPALTISAVIEVVKSDISLDGDDDLLGGELPWETGDMMDDIGLPL